RPPFSLLRTVPPPQGPPFPRPCSLRPLQFCSTAQLPRTRLFLRGPPVPSGSLAACSLLLQGETKAAVPLAEARRCQSAASGKDPARGCPASPAPPGCPRGAGRGRAPRGATP
ncbi:hypothetical protein E2I00_016184, partial [Balaenoptera physalus]